MDFRSGDILFQDIGCGSVCDAINGVTPGWQGAEINHCGLVLAANGRVSVLEAIHPKVQLTSVKDFNNRALDESGRPRVIHSRVRNEYQNLIPDALQFALNVLDTPYDQQFGSDNTAIYCSELIVDAFRYANGGAYFFPESPMTFSDPNTGEILDYWKRYYATFGRPVPKGEIGSNPGELSLSQKLGTLLPLGRLRGLE